MRDLDAGRHLRRDTPDAGAAPLHRIDDDVAACRGQPLALVKPGKQLHHCTRRRAVAHVDPHRRVDLAVVSHERGDVARQVEARDTGAARPVIDRGRAAHRGEQRVGGGIAAAGDHQVDQLERAHVLALADRRGGAGEGLGGDRNQQRKFTAQRKTTLIDAFQVRRGDRDLAGAGHREMLVAQNCHFLAGDQIDCGHADAALRSVCQGRDLLGQRTIIAGREIVRRAHLRAERAVERRFEVDLLRLRRRGSECCGGQREAGRDPSENPQFHVQQPIPVNIVKILTTRKSRATGFAANRIHRAAKRAFCRELWVVTLRPACAGAARTDQSCRGFRERTHWRCAGRRAVNRGRFQPRERNRPR